MPMGFDWDKGNLDKNKISHGVDYQEVEQVFFNEPTKIFKDAIHSEMEERFVAFGVTDAGRKLTIVFTIRKGKIRVISARDRNRKEVI